MGISVSSAGLLTTVQDQGRIGYQKFGVPVSGAMDRRSLMIANILVGNEDSEAVLEITMVGPTLTFSANCVIAITGGDLSPKKNNTPLELYCAHAFHAGDVLSFGAQRNGCRSYIAFAGGLAIQAVMGSCSTYVKAKLGGFEGRPLAAGDKIAFKQAGKIVPNINKRATTPEDFSATNKTLRVIMGPQEDMFTQKGLESFLHTPYSVTNQFDRMGCRLEGDILEYIKDGNIISDGISMGAVQVPSEGKPIILLADRQTTGGYAKIAHIITVDLPIIAQGKFGDIIQFEKITVQEAQKLYLQELESFRTLRASCEACPVSPCSEYIVTLDGKAYQVKVQVAE